MIHPTPRASAGRTPAPAGLRPACAWAGVALALACACAPALAGTTGKLAGRVLDAKKQPLTGVNVTIPAARLGAITGDDGRFAILNIPSGTWEVRAALLGYRGVITQNVRVSADEATALDLTLEEAPVAMKEVVVSAKRPVVDLKLTSNLASVHRDEIRKLPVQELQDVVRLQAGVVGDHFRGGRSGEVQYQVNGITVNDPYDNTTSLKLDRTLLEEVQVISGTFDAEYGQAMSGVVNAVLRRGTDKLTWDTEGYMGGYAFNGDRRGVRSSFRPSDQWYATGTASGPLGLPRTTWLLNVTGTVDKDELRAQRLFTPFHTDTTRTALAKLFAPDGDGASMPLGYSNQLTGVVRITHRVPAGLELNYQAIGNRIDARRADWRFRYDPDGRSRQHTRAIVHGLDVTRTFNARSYAQVGVRQNRQTYRDMVYDDLYDRRYDRAGPPTGDPLFAYSAPVMGVDFTRFQRTTDAIVVKGTLVDQWRRDQSFKAGAEFEWPKVTFGRPGYLVATTTDSGAALVRHVNEPPDYPGPIKWVPYAAAAYAQDELEWNDLKVRGGVRLEYFNSKAGVPSDLANPANAIDGAPESHLRAATRKVSLAPRIGVSFPVTTRSAVFFAYGHFYQMPSLGTVFDNADYSVLRNLQAGGISYGVLGNPDIRPEKTVQYQFGYKQAITDDFGVDATLFYKDIRDLLGVEFVTTYNDAEYARLTNVDFGDVLGATLSLRKRSGLLSATLDYTWQMARGNSSDPRETATRAELGEDPRPRSVPFDWDQRHTLNLTVSLERANVFDAAFILRAASGQPYTPALSTGFGGGLEDNSGRKPPVLIADLRSERQFRVVGQPMSAFARVFNVFDTRFDNGFVFDTSGSPYWSRFPGRDGDQLSSPTRFYPPRRIELGVTLHHGE